MPRTGLRPIPPPGLSPRLDLAVVAVAGVALSTCIGALAQGAPSASPAVRPPTSSPGRATTPAAVDVTEGKVAFYSTRFDGRKTASGERFDSNALTMAHRTLPFGTSVKVTNLANQRSVVVRVNDRGPAQPDRIGDLSLAAARQLGMTRAGTANARLEVVGAAPTREET